MAQVKADAPAVGAVIRRAAGVTVALVLVGVGAAAWLNRGYLDAMVTNRDLAPTETTEATMVPDDGALIVRLGVAGDVGTGDAAEFATTAAMDTLDRQHEYDAVLLLGDNVYENGDPAEVKAKVFDPFAPVLDNGTELIAVLGNHDVEAGNGQAQAEALGMPGLWYSTVIGETEIIALDSNQPSNSTQLAWLDDTLRTSTAKWIIVIMHHPAYSGGWHGSDQGVQENFVPLFEIYGVDLVLSGHDHDYQRTKPINRVTYVVTGAAAKVRATGVESFTEVAYSVNSFVDLAIYSDRIEAQAIDHDGRAIDQFTLWNS